MICIICWDLGLLLHSSLPPDLRRFGGRLFLVFILINCLAPTMTDNGFSANKRMVINQIARHHVFVCVCARSRAADRGTGICGTNLVFTLFALFVRAASCVCFSGIFMHCLLSFVAHFLLFSNTEHFWENFQGLLGFEFAPPTASLSSFMAGGNRARREKKNKSYLVKPQ